MKLVETDPNSGAEIYQLIDDPRPADNIYGEQPYSSADGSRITIRYYPHNDQDGGLSFLDLADGSLHTVIAEAPRFPAFHAWGEHLYYQQQDGDVLVLKRCNYQTLEKEDITTLPTEEGPIQLRHHFPGRALLRCQCPSRRRIEQSLVYRPLNREKQHPCPAGRLPLQTRTILPRRQQPHPHSSQQNARRQIRPPRCS